MRIAHHLPSAVAGGWSARALAQAASVDFGTAKRALRAAHAQLNQKTQQVMGLATQKLAVEAQKARKRALARLERLGKAVDACAKDLEKGGDARDISSAVKAAKDLWKHTEELTGLDVAKAHAIKAQSPGGMVLNWDGVAAIAAAPALPAEGVH